MIGTLAMSSIANAITIEAPKGDAMSKSACPAKINKASNKVSEASLDKNPSPAQIKKRIANLSHKYGLDYDQLHDVLQCESNLMPDRYGDSGLAFGIAQFHKETFDQFCSGDYYNTDDQLVCMAKMFKKGKANHWSCFRRLYDEVIYHETFASIALNK